MTKQCAICGKGSMLTWKLKKLRGKYNPTVKKRKYPNLQWVIIPKEGLKKEKFKKLSGKRGLACTKCIKALAKCK
ncbi:MAG: hypothetical protein FJZ07_01670 [Candidatus Nealsonbacteria bacterium]|nr:hypothetical protein [Candidatus Nealsonbacteria bacterium]